MLEKSTPQNSPRNIIPSTTAIFLKQKKKLTYFHVIKFQTQSLRITDLHRKSHLWRGVVSVTLIEGQGLKAMDANGLSDPYVKFRLGHQKYKSKVTGFHFAHFCAEVSYHILHSEVA